MWLVDRTAFEVSYLRDLEAVEPWNKNTNYGSLVQAGIEGFIKTRQHRGAARFIETEFEKQVKQYEEYDDIAWWAGVAQTTVSTWIDLYAKDLDKYRIDKSEVHHKMTLTLPSGREIVLHGYVDGEGDNVLMENKTRGDWDDDKLAKEIDLNLQVNMYTLFFNAKHGRLPERIWYQHIRRPLGFGYRGPRSKASESSDDFRKRLGEAIDKDRQYHFFRYFIKPTKDRFERFMHLIMYPMLESFLDWYEYMSHPYREKELNKTHWVTPYGLYNPFMEGTLERFREYRLNGSTLGLRPKSR